MIEVPGETEYREQRFLRPQHPRLEHLHRGWQRLQPVARDEGEERRLVGDLPVGIPRAVVRQNRQLVGVGHRTEAPARRRDEVLHDRGAIHFEKEILVGLLVQPTTLRLLFDLGACTHGDEDDAFCFRIAQRVQQPLAGEGHAIDDDPIATVVEALRFARVDPRAAMRGVPRPRLVRQLERALVQLVIARIAEQSLIFRLLDIRDGRGIGQRDHQPALSCCVVVSTGLNWQPSTK